MRSLKTLTIAAALIAGATSLAIAQTGPATGVNSPQLVVQPAILLQLDHPQRVLISINKLSRLPLPRTLNSRLVNSG
jgi:hypothetical protein